MFDEEVLSLNIFKFEFNLFNFNLISRFLEIKNFLKFSHMEKKVT